MELFGKRNTGTLAAIALVVLCVGAAFALNISTTTDGLHVLTLTKTSSTATPSDSGVGYFEADQSGQDTSLVGLFFQGSASNFTNDTFLARADSAGATVQSSGSPKVLSGLVTASASTTASATLYVQSSDTARNTITATFSSADTSTGTWSSALTSASGTSASGFRTASTFSDSKLHFGGPAESDTRLAGGPYGIFQSQWVVDTHLTVAAGQCDSVVIVTAGSHFAQSGDTLRLIVINPAGRVTQDTSMRRLGGGGLTVAADTVALDTVYVTRGVVRFETGITTLVAIWWDANKAKYRVRTNYVTTNSTAPVVIGGGSGVGSTSSNFTAGAGVASVALTLSGSTPTVNSILLADVGNDTSFKSDAYATVDTNTSGMDTRMPFSVYSVSFFAADSSLITNLTSGSITMTVTIRGPVGADSSILSVLRLNEATNKWEVDGTSQTNVFVGANRVITVFGKTKLSIQGLGRIVGSSASVADDDGTCVIANTIGKSPFASMMPSLRIARDSFLSSAVGRMFVSSYYSLGMIAFAMVVGLGLTASKKN